MTCLSKLRFVRRPDDDAVRAIAAFEGRGRRGRGQFDDAGRRGNYLLSRVCVRAIDIAGNYAAQKSSQIKLGTVRCAAARATTTSRHSVRPRFNCARNY